MTLLCVLSFDWSYYRTLAENTEIWRRNFYGTLRVIRYPYGLGSIRSLVHGVILHGSQIVDGPQRDMPITYYGHSSGIARAIESEQRSLPGGLRIGSVGLGTGTLAAYARAGDLFRVYELNPAILEIANRQFSFLGDSQAQVEAVLGDARLSLEDALARGEFAKPEQRFDVLSLDAFSGDAIPMHLLTREAFAIYERVIKPDGVIAFHLTNRFLDLPPVVAQIAHEAGFQAILVADRPPPRSLLDPSDWVLVTRNSSLLRRPEIESGSTPIPRRDGARAWTDQYASLLRVLK
jgi:SAM-dependent methyltransferase